LISPPIDYAKAGPGNGAARKAQPLPRRGDDEPGADYRYRRVYHHHSGNGTGGGDGRNPVVTAAMVSLAIGAILVAAYWLGFQRAEIDRALGPLREDIVSLQSAHGRLDDRVSREFQRIDETKVSDKTRLSMLEELNRRIAAIERAAEAATEHGHLLIQQNTVQDARVEEMRQRMLAIERRLRIANEWESPNPPTPFGAR
jgi:hypothetical protein